MFNSPPHLATDYITAKLKWIKELLFFPDTQTLIADFLMIDIPELWHVRCLYLHMLEDCSSRMKDFS